jgi:endonuclease/exonuclease/phosphatase family metal-dependent hydrolase
VVDRFRRAAWFGLVAAAALAASTAARPGAATVPGKALAATAAATSGRTGPERLKIWAANLKHLNQRRWTDVLDSIASHSNRPDVLLVQEVTRARAAVFVAALERRLGARRSSYSFRLAADGGNAIVWRGKRLSLASAHTAPRARDNLLLWPQWTTRGCDERGHDMLAARLWDRRQRRVVVAASIHWGFIFAARCMQKNLGLLDARIERRWPRRAMTVIGGDFNSHPDKRRDPSDPQAEALDAGWQADPECWYRTFSALHRNRLRHRRPGARDRNCANNRRYRRGADSYIDTVYVATRGRGGGREGGICRQWTYGHGHSTRGTACTDRDRNGLRDRTRIDYIWVRWERRGGARKDPSRRAARRLVGRASADLVCVDEGCRATRYSDHRAVSAAIRWCLPRRGC